MRSHTAHVRALLGAVVALGLFLTTACAGGTRNNGGFVDTAPGVSIVAPEQREPAPVVTGTSLTGQPLRTDQWPGKVLVLNVWGSWCAPCRKEAPALVEAAHRTAADAQFLGLNTRDPDPAPARAFTRTFGVDYPSLYDPDGSALVQYRALPALGIPSTLVIDRQGRVAARVIGEVDANTLTALVTDVAAGR